MIAAHGASVTVSDTTVTISYDPLMSALSTAGAGQVSVSTDEITGIRSTLPTALTCGAVHLDGTDVAVAFSPNQVEETKALVADLRAILSGETPVHTDGDDPSESPGNLQTIPGLDFVGFDVETANDDWGSICQIGLVRYIDGVESESVSWLCTPPSGLDHFAEENIAIHGITPDDVAGQPAFAERLGQMVDFVGDLPLIAHNAQFDFTALSRACAADGIKAPEMVYGCTLALSRGEKLKVVNHRLPTVAEALGVALNTHHDAVEDARACGGIATALARQRNFSGSFVDFFHTFGFTLGTIDDDRVYPVLRDRSGANIALQRRRFAGEPDVASDPASGSSTPTSVAPSGAQEKPATERPQRGSSPAPWSRVATPDTIPDPNLDADPDGVLYGQNVTLTGDFAPHDKGDLWRMIASQGAQVGKNVTKKTTILVAGPWTTVTSKQKRAEELIEKGQEIQIWDDTQLYAVLGLNEQPPF